MVQIYYVECINCHRWVRLGYNPPPGEWWCDECRKCIDCGKDAGIPDKWYEYDYCDNPPHLCDECKELIRLLNNLKW